MIAGLLWKEYREQRNVWLALVLLTGFLVLGLPALLPAGPADQRSYQEILPMVALLLAWTYAVVCGGMLLAGEVEGGTQTYLDALPVSRGMLWRGKALVGLVLLATHLAVVAAMVLTSGLLIQPGVWKGWLLALVGFGVGGLGWGLFFSARAVTVLPAVGQALLVQFVLFALTQYVSLLVSRTMGPNQEMPGIGWVAFLPGWILILVGGWPLSVWQYTALDRQRGLEGGAGGTSGMARRAAWRLAWARLRGLIVTLVILSGLALIPLLIAPLVTWPLVGWMLGTLCGVTVLFDEQAGARQFLSDQRLPLAPIWSMKCLVRLGLAVGCCFLLVIPLAMVLLLQSDPQRNTDGYLLVHALTTRLAGWPRMMLLFLVAPVTIGFAVGQLSGMLWRRPLTAAVVGGALGLLLLGVWVPSYLMRGLHIWQVLGVPIVLLAGSWWLLRLWATDRLQNHEGITRLILLGVVAVGFLTLAIWARVAEVPRLEEPAGWTAFLEGLPAPGENLAGQQWRSALSSLQPYQHAWVASGRGGRGAPGQEAISSSASFQEQVREIVQRGWPDKPGATTELGGWLDELFKEPVWKTIADLAQEPVGMIDDPRQRMAGQRLTLNEPAHLAGQLLAVRGLQLQQRGQPQVFPEHLDQALALVRSYSRAGTAGQVIASRAIEAFQLEALDRWLEQLAGRPDLLRRVAQVLQKQRDWLPPNHHENDLADYLVGLNSMEHPEEWMRDMLVHQASVAERNEVMLLGLVSRLPWERARQQRLWRMVAFGSNEEVRELEDSINFLLPLFYHRAGRLERGGASRLARLEASRLKVALRQYQVDQGQLPRTLNELVPKYLPAVPLDPGDQQPFRYRISPGEEIEWPGDAHHPPTKRTIPEGQGILWDVGPNTKDDGGTKCFEDNLWLVPLLPR
ncbi:MAG: hypothetical protein U0840_13260 [Gemmataceae bacterium]